MINETDYNNNPLSKEQENQIDAIFAQYDTTDKPGCAVGVIKDGRFIYKKSFGLANLDYNIPITAESKFDVCSMTKQFTAACIALLQMEGKLDFDDDVRQYIPELPDFGKAITIRHLILHTSGLKDHYCFMEFIGRDFDKGQRYFNNKDVIRQISKVKELNFTPGEQFQYSNTGYVILAEIISKVSGQSFSEFAKERIFKPLKMDNSFINDNWKQVIKDRVVSYEENKKGEYDTYVQIDENVGDGGLVTTVNDLFLWDENYYSGKVGGEELRKIVSSFKTDFDVYEDWRYGLGICHYKQKNLSVVSHNGSARGFETDLKRIPDHKTSIIVLCNNAHSATTPTSNIAEIVLAEFITEPELVQINQDESKESFSSDLDMFCGHYCAVRKDDEGLQDWYVLDNDGDLMTRKIYNKDGNLFYWRSETSEAKLVQKSESEFMIEGMKAEVTLVFEITSHEKMMKSYVKGKCSNEFKAYEPDSFPLERLHEYTGRFYSNELEVEYQITVENDKLAIYIEDRKLVDAELIVDSAFFIDEWNAVLKFCFDESNEITGLVVGSSRAQKMIFEKHEEIRR